VGHTKESDLVLSVRLDNSSSVVVAIWYVYCFAMCAAAGQPAALLQASCIAHSAGCPGAPGRARIGCSGCDDDDWSLLMASAAPGPWPLELQELPLRQAAGPPRVQHY
jgi:hypothetical protein